MSKYSVLRDYLLNFKKDKWHASFSEIEDVLGFRLPKSAYQYQEWWSNYPAQPHAKYWHDAGWRSCDVNLSDRTVVFLKYGLVEKNKIKKARKPITNNADSLPHHNWDSDDEFKMKLKMKWQPIGRVILSNDVLLFPHVDKVPGIYRIRIRYKDNTEALYVGETVNLKRRLYNYKNPYKRQQTSWRINEKLVSVLKKGAEVSISIVTSNKGVLDLDKDTTLDLSSKVVRCLFENAALLNGGAQDIENLNKAS